MSRRVINRSYNNYYKDNNDSTTTTIISWEGRSEYTPATSTHYSHGFFSHSVGGSQPSQCVGHIPHPAIPPYYIQSPHCMAPRRWRIPGLVHLSAPSRLLVDSALFSMSLLLLISCFMNFSLCLSDSAQTAVHEMTDIGKNRTGVFSMFVIS